MANTAATGDGASNGSADLARMMVPSDANVAGNVHGGTIMQLMEEAAGVAAHRYFASNNFSTNHVAALLSRVERLSFQHPIYVGDVAKIKATVVFTSQHSVAVCVQVRAERMPWSNTGSSRGNVGSETVCNRALLWLVGILVPSTGRIVDTSSYSTRAVAPPFPIPSDKDSWAWKQYQEAWQLYEARKLLNGSNSQLNLLDSGRTAHEAGLWSTPNNQSALVAGTPDHSAVEIAQVMLPSDCVDSSGMVSGGVVMKLMDNACGIVAVRHCGSAVVTVAVAEVNLLSPVMLGDVVMVRAKAIFTSRKSMEIAVSVRAERHVIDQTTGWMHPEIVDITDPAIFAFVALPWKKDNPSALPMKPLQLTTQHDQDIFEKRKIQYNQRRSMGGRPVVAKL